MSSTSCDAPATPPAIASSGSDARIDAERTLIDGFQSYADAIKGSQGVHEAKVYSDTALVVAATFAAGAASIEMLNAAFAVEAASMSPEALAVAEQLEAGAAAARSAAQAAARLPELASRLNTAKNLASVAQGAELAAAANAEIVALEGAIASAQTTIQAGAAAADATTTLASQLARLTQSSLPAQLWARFKGVGTLFLDLATNQAVDASKAARTWLRRDDPERQRQLVEETLRAAEVQRDLVQKGADDDLRTARGEGPARLRRAACRWARARRPRQDRRPRSPPSAEGRRVRAARRAGGRDRGRLSAATVRVITPAADDRPPSPAESLTEWGPTDAALVVVKHLGYAP